MIEVDKSIRLSQNYYSSFDGKWSDFLINFENISHRVIPK